MGGSGSRSNYTFDKTIFKLTLRLDKNGFKYKEEECLCYEERCFYNIKREDEITKEKYLNRITKRAFNQIIDYVYVNAEFLEYYIWCKPEKKDEAKETLYLKILEKVKFFYENINILMTHVNNLEL